MKRRDFLRNSALFIGFAPLLTGCNQEEENIRQVVRRQYKDFSLPLLALGETFTYSPDDKTSNPREFQKRIDFAMSHGMNYFDVAYMYESETVENLLAKALKKYPRKDYILGEKMSVYSVKSKEDVRKIFEKQLKIYNVEYFDNYSIFNIVKKNINNFYKFEIYDELLKLKKEGKIKNLGFSGPTNPTVFDEVAKKYKWDFCQLKINYLDWEDRYIDKLFEIVKNLSIPTIALESLKGGTLASFPQEITDKIKKEFPSETQGSLAQKWVASKSNIVSVLLDTNDFDLLRESAMSFSKEVKFGMVEEKTVQKIKQFIASTNPVNCNSCGHCRAECPQEIDIPAIILLYNNYKIDNNKNKFIAEYKKINENKRADACIHCNRCMPCHRKLNIPEILGEIDSKVKELGFRA